MVGDQWQTNLDLEPGLCGKSGAEDLFSMRPQIVEAENPTDQETKEGSIRNCCFNGRRNLSLVQPLVQPVQFQY